VSPYWIGAVLAWFACAVAWILICAWNQAAETDRSEDLANVLHLEWDEDRDRPVWEMVERHRESVANPVQPSTPRLYVVKGNAKPLRLRRGCAPAPIGVEGTGIYHVHKG
jgi:hypothetical protein